MRLIGRRGYGWIDTRVVDRHEAPCEVSSVKVDVRVSGLYAMVDTELGIRNPNGRPVSADLSLPMPDGAAVCGYAVETDGEMVPAAVVERERGRVAFEEEERAGADPGLVESVAGNAYRTRVHPIAAASVRRVRLSCVAPLTVSGDGASLTVPMPGRVRDAGIAVRIAPGCGTPSADGIRLTESDGTWSGESSAPTSGDVRIVLDGLPDRMSGVEAASDGTRWFYASERMRGTRPDVEAEGRRLVIAWDCSGSRASRHDVALGVVRRLTGFSAYTLVRFSDSAETEGFVDADGIADALSGVRYDGGTDMSSLAGALSRLGLADGDVVALFTDGVGTLGGTPRLPDVRCVTFVDGASRDTEALRQMCRGLVYDVADAPSDGDGLVRAAFGRGRLTGISGDGYADVIGIGSGADGRATVLGRLVAGTARVLMDGSDEAFELSDGADGDVIATAWAARRVGQLSVHADANSDELLAVGRRFGVVSPATSLVAFETVGQWVRHGIEPPRGLTRLHAEWERAMSGRMSLGDDGERHMRALRGAWARRMSWWKGVSDAQCPVCGGTLPDGAAFCPSCGTAVGGALIGRAVLDAFGGPMPLMAEAEMGGPAPTASMSPSPMRGMACASPMPADAARGDVSMTVRAWEADAGYIGRLDAADDPRDEYLSMRGAYATSPSFFLDTACWFLDHGDHAFGVHVLTNLAEVRVDAPELLRVMGWRLRECGELDMALSAARRVALLRGEDSQSYRDVAIVLVDLVRRELGDGDVREARAHAGEAAEAYERVIRTPWRRRDIAAGLVAVEELNVFRAWCGRQDWDGAPPDLGEPDEGLDGVPDCDLRVTLAWDADETDVDLHVTEPTGEEAYYAHRLTSSGGLVSEDVTDGFGPEQYAVRHARDGEYVIRAHYYASHQRSVFGPATCTLSVFTNWGRDGQERSITTTRLDLENELTEVGRVRYGDGPGAGHDRPDVEELVFRDRMRYEDLTDAYGTPTYDERDGDTGELIWKLPGGRTRVATAKDDGSFRVAEVFPGGEEMIVVD